MKFKHCSIWAGSGSFSAWLAHAPPQPVFHAHGQCTRTRSLKFENTAGTRGILFSWDENFAYFVCANAVACETVNVRCRIFPCSVSTRTFTHDMKSSLYPAQANPLFLPVTWRTFLSRPGLFLHVTFFGFYFIGCSLFCATTYFFRRIVQSY